jgi:hypothetical protein
LNSFSGSATLSEAVSDLSIQWSINPLTVTIPAAGSALSTITLTTTTTTCKPGSFNVAVTAGQHGIDHTINIPVTEACPPDFTVTPPGISFWWCSGLGSTRVTQVTLQSYAGFSGAVSMSSSSSPGGLGTWMDPSTVTLAAGGVGASALYVDSGKGSSSTPPGSYTITVTGTSGSLIHSTTVSEYLYSFQTCPPGSGSVASGTLITMADESREAVQNILVGSRVVVYDITSGDQTIATVTQILTHSSDTLLTLHTSAGLPFRADANPQMKLHVLVNGQPVLKPITEIQPGDRIYNWELQAWVTVTNVTVATGGQHTMYDLITNPQYTSSGAVLEYIANGYPDCSQPCKL